MYALNSFQDSEQFKGDFVSHEAWGIRLLFALIKK